MVVGEEDVLREWTKSGHLVDANGIRNHNLFFWTPSSVRNLSLPDGSDPQVYWIKDPVLLIKRFYPQNVMHALHDDVFPLLSTLAANRRLRASKRENSRDPALDTTGDEMSLDLRVIAIDDYHDNAEARMIEEQLSLPVKIWNIHELVRLVRSQQSPDYICFSEAWSGISSASTWYQYGFRGPQGPLFTLQDEQAARMVGHEVTRAVRWMTREMTRGMIDAREHFHEWRVDTLAQRQNRESASRPCISVLSRTRNRVMLNERHVTEDIAAVFPDVEVRVLRHEEMTLGEMIRVVRNSVALVGMHGALMVLSAFLPPGAVVVELFPYGISADNYTPYRTLVQLPGLDLTYRSWMNGRGETPFNVGHPARSAGHGGITHLSLEEQRRILESPSVPPHTCCNNPHWLYRIYQDTIVDTTELVRLLCNAMDESLSGKV